MPVFTNEFTVKAPLEAVVKFHRDTRALKKLSPPPMVVQLHRVDPMAEGSVSEFTMWLGPIPIRWHAIHSQVGPTGFIDTQKQGPLAFWQHTHHFQTLEDGQTRVQDRVEYQHHPGIQGLFTRVLFSKVGLIALFTYRKWATRRALKEKS
jgi:ligand-binding SRPBCC domain-containing protein